MKRVVGLLATLYRELRYSYKIFRPEWDWWRWGIGLWFDAVAWPAGSAVFTQVDQRRRVRPPALRARRGHQHHRCARERSPHSALVHSKLFNDPPVVVLHTIRTSAAIIPAQVC